jgi:hypothetical protein
VNLASYDAAGALTRTPPGRWVEDHPDLVLIGGATVVSAALAPVLIPLILNGLGFGAGGVVAGSWAAGVHAYLGNVVAGSLFALAQSAGAGAALPLVGWLASAGLGLSAGLIADVIRILIKKILASGFTQYLSLMGGAMRMLLGRDSGHTLRQAWLRIMSRRREGIEPEGDEPN